MKYVLILAVVAATSACTTLDSVESKDSLSSENQKAVIEATEVLKK